ALGVVEPLDGTGLTFGHFVTPWNFTVDGYQTRRAVPGLCRQGVTRTMERIVWIKPQAALDLGSTASEPRCTVIPLRTVRAPYRTFRLKCEQPAPATSRPVRAAARPARHRSGCATAPA